jgi:hypothetical protein
VEIGTRRTEWDDCFSFLQHDTLDLASFASRPGTFGAGRLSERAPECFESFIAALELWKYVKDYDPGSAHVPALQTQRN